MSHYRTTYPPHTSSPTLLFPRNMYSFIGSLALPLATSQSDQKPDHPHQPSRRDRHLRRYRKATALRTSCRSGRRRRRGSGRASSGSRRWGGVTQFEGGAIEDLGGHAGDDCGAVARGRGEGDEGYVAAGGAVDGGEEGACWVGLLL